MTDTQEIAKQWLCHRMRDHCRCGHHREFFNLLENQLWAATETTQNSTIHWRRIDAANILHMQRILVDFLFVSLSMRMRVIVVVAIAVRHFPVINRTHCVMMNTGRTLHCQNAVRTVKANNFAFNHNIYSTKSSMLIILSGVNNATHSTSSFVLFRWPNMLARLLKRSLFIWFSMDDLFIQTGTQRSNSLLLAKHFCACQQPQQ